jgi:hypothetical protein
MPASTAISPLWTVPYLRNPFYEEQLGDQHPEVILTLNYLGLLYEEQGKCGQAERYYQRVLTIQEQQLEVSDDTILRVGSPTSVVPSLVAFKTR